MLYNVMTVFAAQVNLNNSGVGNQQILQNSGYIHNLQERNTIVI